MLYVVLAIIDFIVTAIAQPLYIITKVGDVLGAPNCLLSNINGSITFLCLSFSLSTIVILSLSFSYFGLSLPLSNYRYYGSFKDRCCFVLASFTCRDNLSRLLPAASGNLHIWGCYCGFCDCYGRFDVGLDSQTRSSS